MCIGSPASGLRVLLCGFTRWGLRNRTWGGCPQRAKEIPSRSPPRDPLLLSGEEGALPAPLLRRRLHPPTRARSQPPGAASALPPPPRALKLGNPRGNDWPARRPRAPDRTLRAAAPAAPPSRLRAARPPRRRKSPCAPPPRPSAGPAQARGRPLGLAPTPPSLPPLALSACLSLPRRRRPLPADPPSALAGAHSFGGACSQPSSNSLFPLPAGAHYSPFLFPSARRPPGLRALGLGRGAPPRLHGQSPGAGPAPGWGAGRVCSPLGTPVLLVFFGDQRQKKRAWDTHLRDPALTRKMSPSGRLCLLTILGLLLPTRGQTLEEPTSIPNYYIPNPTTVDTRVLTQVPGETTQSKTETLTPTASRRPTGMDALLVTDAGTHLSSEEGSTVPSERPTPGRDARLDPPTPRPPGSEEDDPFFYDETTLRRRGLLVAAVLFITGIIILTSGKCRQLSKLCRSR